MTPFFLIGLALAGLLLLRSKTTPPLYNWRLKWRWGDTPGEYHEAMVRATHRRNAVNELAIRLGRQQPGRISIISDINEMESNEPTR